MAIFLTMMKRTITLTTISMLETPSGFRKLVREIGIIQVRSGNYLMDHQNITDSLPPSWCDRDLYALLITAIPSPNGYVTVLNCPQCGCTSGQTDVITLDQLESG